MNKLLKYLSSFIVIFNSIRNILLKINKPRIIKILKIVSTFVFLRQSILLLNDYLKYETVIDLKLIDSNWGKDLESNPAITLCLKSSRFHSEKIENSSIMDRIGNITCTATSGKKIFY
jgi:hypothetical protein